MELVEWQSRQSGALGGRGQSRRSDMELVE